MDLPEYERWLLTRSFQRTYLLDELASDEFIDTFIDEQFERWAGLQPILGASGPDGAQVPTRPISLPGIEASYLMVNYHIIIVIRR